MSQTIYSKDHKRMISKLIKARIDADLTQEAVARRLRRTQSYISKIESGQRRLDIVQLKKLVKVYSKSVEDFV